MSALSSLGVSVAICCYNSAILLPPTLQHLRAQAVPPDVPWEVLVVDNGSTDGTAEVARKCWPDDKPAPLRIVREARRGLSRARECAFREASYGIVSFVDDDNWVCDQWITSANRILTLNPLLGAVGSLAYPAFETPPPIWWYNFAGYFSLILETPHDAISVLNGAGMTIRKAAWEAIVRDGFRFRLIDRKGSKLSTGGDYELTYALHVAGWELHVDPHLRLVHFMPAERLTWRYLRSMVRHTAASLVLLTPFLADAQEAPLRQGDSWYWRALAEGKYCLARPRRILRWMFSRVEGDAQILGQEGQLGRIIGLLTFRGEYTRLMRTRRVAERQTIAV